jgi:hypothetical protein
VLRDWLAIGYGVGKLEGLIRTTVAERVPKVLSNCGITVNGPIVPVSRPNKSPPIDTIIEACTYFGGGVSNFDFHEEVNTASIIFNERMTETEIQMSEMQERPRSS